MNITTVIIGVAAILFGIYTLYLRIKSPEKLGKLNAMKDKFGNGIGNAIHFIAYSLIPLAAGAIFIFAGLKGASLF
jgi:hypothetical protein